MDLARTNYTEGILPVMDSPGALSDYWGEADESYYDWGIPNHGRSLRDYYCKSQTAKGVVVTFTHTFIQPAT